MCTAWHLGQGLTHTGEAQAMACAAPCTAANRKWGQAMADYAWIIDTDHLARAERRLTGRCEDDAKGRTGPRDAPDDMLAVLNGTADNRSGWDMFTFKMHDDDGILYYTGRLIADDSASEAACYAPLGDFGDPNAGCVSVTYPGHKDMDCG